MIPRFAVVGHPNKGKSSIVATLAEDPNVEIADTPGTTRKSRAFPLSLNGEILYELIDTPGFQRPREILAWLEAHCSSASERAATVANFVAEHREDERFADECELLRPLIAGAGILYVVDASRPYGREYEAEMQILQWTGRPRMAVINMIAEGDFLADWQRALDQYFSLVRLFNAHYADIPERLALLRSFGALHEPWSASIAHVVAVLESEYDRRQHLAARLISDLIVKALTDQRFGRVGKDADPVPIQTKLERELRDALRSAEKDTRRQIESIYTHHGLEVSDDSMVALDSDLFSTESEELFGLSRAQLITTSAISGAIAGGSIDVLLGGASLLAGAGVGALIGGASAVFGSEKIAKIEILGQSLGTRKITVGPFRDANLVWVLLSRALVHHTLVRERNHARREALVIDAQSGNHFADSLAKPARNALSREFAAIRDDGFDGHSSTLIDLLDALLKASGGNDSLIKPLRDEALKT